MCDPPVMDTDKDFLVRIWDNKSSFISKLEELGFLKEGGDSDRYGNAVEAANGFTSYRKGDINLIVTADSQFAENWERATALCTKLNLLKRDDRVEVFKAFLYQ